MSELITNRPANTHIERVTVEKLFGHYNYDLKPDKDEDTSKLIIFYGDNGSGKTTLLKLIFNLLSSLHGKGHKGNVAKVRFKQITIYLTDGTKVQAIRTGNKLIGSYQMSIARGRRTSRVTFTTDERSRATTVESAEEEQRYSDILERLSELNLSLYLLGDDRKVLSNVYSEEDEITTIVNPKYISHRYELEGFVTTSRVDEEEGLDIGKAVQRLVSWINQQVLTGTSIGQANANTIYSDIAERIVLPASTKQKDAGQRAGELTADLLLLAQRNEAFSKFGLTTHLSTTKLVSAVQTASPYKLRVLHNILKPYLDGIRARLDALQSVQESISTFINNINTFYSNKVVSFHLDRGLIIQTSEGERLNPKSLSSGEKQLLLLFCNIVVAQDQQSIFIIDEPELSLNIKWQRRLIKALLECVKGGRMQFLLATHSLELLSLHSHNVWRLEDITSNKSSQLSSHEPQ